MGCNAKQRAECNSGRIGRFGRYLVRFFVKMALVQTCSLSQALTRQLSQGESPWQSTQASSLCQSLSLWERWICEAKTERARMLSVVLLQKKEHRNARRCSGVPRFIRNDQIRLRASSSPTRMKSGCSCRMLAGTSGVTGPKKAFLTISALPAPLTTISTLRACMMVRMPMV